MARDTPDPAQTVRLIALNKPYGVLCQFTDARGRPNLADYVPVPDVYPAGRLDRDSEGLLLLTDDGRLQHSITHPAARRWKRYLAQVEGCIDEAALARLRAGVSLGGKVTRPARARVVPSPGWLWPRHPPIRYRRHIPTVWLELQICEGRNRQVRRMTAAVGHPTLRLLRVAIGPIGLAGLLPGQWRDVDPRPLLARKPGITPRSRRRSR